MWNVNNCVGCNGLMAYEFVSLGYEWIIFRDELLIRNLIKSQMWCFINHFVFHYWIYSCLKSPIFC